jgi:hypothetical protein
MILYPSSISLRISLVTDYAQGCIPLAKKTVKIVALATFIALGTMFALNYPVLTFITIVMSACALCSCLSLLKKVMGPIEEDMRQAMKELSSVRQDLPRSDMTARSAHAMSVEAYNRNQKDESKKIPRDSTYKNPMIKIGSNQAANQAANIINNQAKSLARKDALTALDQRLAPRHT